MTTLADHRIKSKRNDPQAAQPADRVELTCACGWYVTTSSDPEAMAEWARHLDFALASVPHAPQVSGVVTPIPMPPGVAPVRLVPGALGEILERAHGFADLAIDEEGSYYEVPASVAHEVITKAYLAGALGLPPTSCNDSIATILRNANAHQGTTP